MSAVLFDVPGPRARARQRIGTALGALAFGALMAWVLWTLWKEEQITPDQWEAFTKPTIIRALAEGLVYTLLSAAAAIALAIVFGVVFASGRLSDHAVLRWPSIVVVEFFRAVPLLLLILFLFIGFGSVLGRFWALVLGLVLYNGSVLAEIFRAGILSVPRGQREAGYAIGLRKSEVMRLILAPQAVGAMLPAIISQCVVALKDTALGFVIGAAGIIQVGELIYISPLYRNELAVAIVLAVVFIVINYALSKLAQWLEARQRRAGRAVVAEPEIGEPAEVKADPT
jgi:glutamate transport system permease protein